MEGTKPVGSPRGSYLADISTVILPVLCAVIPVRRNDAFYNSYNSSNERLYLMVERFGA